MATKIKVKKITDLTKIFAEKGPDNDESKVVSPNDQLVVAHMTNQDESGRAVMHTTAMEIEQLLKYVSTQLQSKYMTLDSGTELSDYLTNRLESKIQEMENNMAIGSDVYSSNYFMDDTGVKKFSPSLSVEENSISGWYTDEYIFKSSCVANVHLTIYNNNAGSSAGQPQGQAYAKIQMYTKSGNWKTICQQPLQCSDGAFDIDLHGYFFAGTKIRGWFEQHNSINNYYSNIVNFDMSNLQVTRFSTDKGFEENSFDWWVSNEKASTSDINPPQTISAPGFFSFSGLYYSEKRDGSTQNSYYPVGSQPYDYKDNANYYQGNIKRHYCMNAVYANIKYLNGASYKLGNTQNDNVTQGNSGIRDGFSGKYYYVNPTPENPVSAFTTTDFVFNDMTQGNGKADSGGGYHNATLIKYTEFGEISSVAGTTLSIVDGSEVTVPVSVYTYNDLSAKYANGGNNKYRFTYNGGLGYFDPADASQAGTFYPYVGSDSRNIAALQITSYNNTPGCYVKESQTSWKFGATDGMPPPDRYAFVPTMLGEQNIRSIIRDDDPNKWDGNDSVKYQTINYNIEVLNENVESLGVGKSIRAYYPNFDFTSQYPDASYERQQIDYHLLDQVSAGWSLISVDIAKPAGDESMTLADFAFASCPRLQSFKFNKNINATGVYTFAAPPRGVPYIKTEYVQGASFQIQNQNRTEENMSQLTSIQFYNDGQKRTHIVGYENHPGEILAMFSNCRNLKSINLQDTDVKSIGACSFQNCKRLTKIEIPSTCSKIGKYAFNGCSSLTSIIFPSTLSEFESDTAGDFTGCPALTSTNSWLGTGYQYRLGSNYDITIKLQHEQSYYYAGGSATDLNKYRTTIFPEISALVTYLQTQNLGCATYYTSYYYNNYNNYNYYRYNNYNYNYYNVWNTTKFNTDYTTGNVTGIASNGYGRRYYLIDSTGKYINIDGSSKTERDNNGNLTFNPIAVDATSAVMNMIVPYSESTNTYLNKSVDTAYVTQQC